MVKEINRTLCSTQFDPHFFLTVFEKLIKYMHFAISLLLLFKGSIGDHIKKRNFNFLRGAKSVHAIL